MLHYITGGERSGKSSYAEHLAENMSDHPYYLATSRKYVDADFQQRIKRHISDRENSETQWITIEADRDLSQAIAKHCTQPKPTIVIDCVTLWLTNYVLDYDYDIDICLKKATDEIEQLVTLATDMNATIFIISNEIGMSLHANTPEGRKFVSLQGWVNQTLAKHADKATMVVSGLPLVLK